MKLRISFASAAVEVDLSDTPTARALFARAPFESTAQTWGVRTGDRVRVEKA